MKPLTKEQIEKIRNRLAEKIAGEDVKVEYSGPYEVHKFKIEENGSVKHVDIDACLIVAFSLFMAEEEFIARELKRIIDEEE